MKMQSNTRTVPAGNQTEVARKQHGRLLIALAILLVAFIAVLVRDSEFWFGSDAAVDSTPANSVNATAPALAAAPAKTIPTPVAQAVTPKNQVAPQASTFTSTSTQPVVAERKHTANPVTPVVVAKRPALVPLQVEMVTRDTQRTIHLANNAGSNVAKLEMPKAELPSKSTHQPAATMTVASLPMNAAEREPISSANAELRPAVDSTYPLLGPKMSVEGSVVLQAVIGTDGTIEDLRVVSGPAILSVAARQAVRQWHFKPYLQNGQAVETKATITVNFSIRVSDNPAKSS
jgi:TonB family protein